MGTIRQGNPYQLLTGDSYGRQLQHYKAKLEYEIDPWDLNEALGRGDKILVVDTRTPEAYGRSHIPGAINIPHRTMNTATTAPLDFRVKELIGGLDPGCVLDPNERANSVAGAA